LQQTVGLSSAESEYYAMVKGACYGLGTQSYLMDWDIKIGLEVYSDSSSARSFAKRQGLGKMRHIMTRYLWMQERVRLGHLQVICIKGDENPADLFTKALSRADIMRHCNALGCSAVQTAASGSDDAPLTLTTYDDLYGEDIAMMHGSWTTVTRQMRRRKQFGRLQQ
jgi:hypothetical protein